MRIKSKTLVALLTLVIMFAFSGCAILGTKSVDLSGSWTANISSPQGEAELFMYITKSDDGEYAATLDVAVMGAFDIPLSFELKGSTVTYDVGDSGYTFAGKLTDASTIEGISTSPDGSETELIFKRN